MGFLLGLGSKSAARRERERAAALAAAAKAETSKGGSTGTLNNGGSPSKGEVVKSGRSAAGGGAAVGGGGGAASATTKSPPRKDTATPAAAAPPSKVSPTNAPQLISKSPSRENHNPNISERKFADPMSSTQQATDKSAAPSRRRMYPGRRNEAVQLRKSIVADRRKSQVNTPAPANPNPTLHNPSVPWNYESITRALATSDWIRLENLLWQVGTCVYKDKSLCSQILNDGVLTKCIEAASLPSASRGVYQKAVYIVSQVTLLDEAEDPMRKAGVIPMLKSVLATSVDSHTISFAVRALRNLLSSSEEIALQVGKDQCVHSLLDIISGAHGVVFATKEVGVIVVREAAAGIANLAQFGLKYQNQVVRAQGLKLLVNLLATTSDDETKYHTTKAVATCASESRFHNQLVDYGALVEAQRLLHSCKDLSTVAEAARLLGNIAQTGSGRHRVVDSGGVEELIERLIRSADKAPAAPIPDIVNALHNVCLSEKASLTAWLRGAISILVQLAARTGEVDLEMLKEVCVNTLVNIAQTGQKNNVLRTIEQAIEQIQQSNGACISDFQALKIRLVELIGEAYTKEIPRSLEHLSRASKQVRGQSNGGSNGSGSGQQNFQFSGRMIAVSRGREAKASELHKDQFALGQVLGKGGYGTVYLAQKIGTDEPHFVAIKQFHTADPHQSRLAVKEQRIWEGLDHPNVVKYEGCFIADDGGLNLVVEYIDGWSLARHLSRFSAFPEDLVAEITRQILDGLEYLHANGVTHRDLKPANVMVSQDGKVKITDFGVSSSTNVQTLGQGNTMVGTPWYIAPEMVEQRPYTSSVDIWSLGCTMMELATGKRPYHELSAMQAMFRMVQDRRPPIPSSLSPLCQSFLENCWIWDPELRPSATKLKTHPFLTTASKK